MHKGLHMSKNCIIYADENKKGRETQEAGERRLADCDLKDLTMYYCPLKKNKNIDKPFECFRSDASYTNCY